MTPRLAKILDAYDSFNSTTRKRLVAGNLYDYFMQEFRGEIEMIYNSATKEDIKEDVKGMAEGKYYERGRRRKKKIATVWSRRLSCYPSARTGSRRGEIPEQP